MKKERGKDKEEGQGKGLMVIEDGKDSKREMEGVKKMEVKREEGRGKKR